MRRHLGVAGRGLAAIGLTSALAYLIATKTSSVTNPPEWLYWLFLGIVVAGVFLYFIGERRPAANPHQTKETDKEAAIDQNSGQEDEPADPAGLARLRAARSVNDRWRSGEDDLISRSLQFQNRLPAVLFAAGGAILLRLRDVRTVNITDEMKAITSNPAQLLIIMLLLLVVTTVVTQLLSLDAIRILEGDWPGGGLPSLARTQIGRAS